MTKRFAFAASALLLAFGCSSSSSGGANDTGAGGSSAGGTNGAGAGSNCPVVSTTDGTNACNANTCTAGEYCAGVNCLMGCESTGNCSVGMECDLSTSTMGFNGKPIGTCRVPAACGQGAGGTSAQGGSTSAQGGGSSCLIGGDSACVSCGESACGSKISGCFGPNAASGQFSGTCGAFGQCATACGCSQTCLQQCQSQLTPACQTCIADVNMCLNTSCAAQCNPSSGTGGTSSSGQGGAGGTTATAQSCTDLVACCQKITDTAQQMQCAAEASSGIDQVCMMALTGYKAQNLCP